MATPSDPRLQPKNRRSLAGSGAKRGFDCGWGEADDHFVADLDRGDASARIEEQVFVAGLQVAVDVVIA
jgi:hypothetical protein